MRQSLFYEVKALRLDIVVPAAIAAGRAFVSAAHAAGAEHHRDDAVLDADLVDLLDEELRIVGPRLQSVQVVGLVDLEP